MQVLWSIRRFQDVDSEGVFNFRLGTNQNRFFQIKRQRSIRASGRDDHNSWIQTGLLDCLDVKVDQRSAFGDLLVLLNENLESFAAKRNCIDADVK